MAVRSYCVSASVALGLILAVGSARRAEALDPRDFEVAARYAISFAGVDIGGFDFKARIKDARYKLEGRGKLKALFGALKWDGRMESEGFVNGTTLLPAAYRHKFDTKRKTLFKTKRKSATVDLAFQNGRINLIQVEPPAKTSGRVPLTADHFQDVLDPMSAIMALSALSIENPCNRTVEVFDGKTRFRLAMRYLKRDPTRSKGAAYDYTCGVHYIPVAGHKRSDEEAEHLAKSGDIVVVLRTFPSAQLALAREVRISTLAGTAAATIKDADLVTAGREKSALIR